MSLASARDHAYLHRMTPVYRIAIALLLCMAPAPLAAETVTLGERSYAVRQPAQPATEGAPLLIHLHGWGRTAEGVLRNQRVTGAADAIGALLIAPQGLGKSWSFWSDGSRDTAFIDAVVEDAARRWRVDRDRVYISGFSYGGAMVWRLACERGRAYAAYLPIAGGLWRQDEERCAGPARIHHVHGLRDTVMDPPGDPQTDPASAVSLWLRENAHATTPDRTESLDRYERRVWAARADAREVVLDLHKGGHFIPKDWLRDALTRLEAESPPDA